MNVAAALWRPISRMNPKSALGAVFLVFALLALGCSPPAETPQSGGQGSEVAGAEKKEKEGASAEEKSEPSAIKESETEAAVRKIMSTPIATDSALQIKPSGKAPGYKPASKAASLKEIGQKVDGAIAKLPASMVDGRITFSTREGELMGRVEIMVQNASTFKVQYNMPKLKAESGAVVGDGRRIAEKQGTAWKLKSKVGGAASQTDLQQWPLEFTSMMFAPLTDSKLVWGPLFDSWQKRGAKVEERPQELNGKKKMLYRVILAEKDSQLEVVLDGDRMLPLTVRSDVPRKGGGRDRMMWTGQWAFGGSHQASDFLIPVK